MSSGSVYLNAKGRSALSMGKRGKGRDTLGLTDEEWGWQLGASQGSWSHVQAVRPVYTGYFTPMSQRKRMTCEGTDDAAEMANAEPMRLNLSEQPGMCYLRLLDSSKWQHYADVFGPKIRLLDLARVPLADCIPAARLAEVRIRMVGDGCWHCDRDGNVLFAEVMAAVSQYEKFKPGTLGFCWAGNVHAEANPSQVLGLDVGVHHAQLVSATKRDLVALARREAPNAAGLVWLVPSQFEFSEVHNEHRLRASKVLHVKPGRLTLAADDRAVVRLPLGCKMKHRDVLYGNDQSAVWFAFRGECTVTLMSQDSVVRVVAVVGARTDWALDKMLHPKCTDARFVREVEADAVLKFPERVSTVMTGGREWKKVQITDPLEDWNAVHEDRLECDAHGKSHESVDLGMCAFKSFRTMVPARFEVNGFVSMCDRDSAFAAVGLLDLEVVFEKDELGTRVKNGSCDTRWSVRRLYCADAYCLDNGGPSDSEGFSDAV